MGITVIQSECAKRGDLPPALVGVPMESKEHWEQATNRSSFIVFVEKIAS